MLTTPIIISDTLVTGMALAADMWYCIYKWFGKVLFSSSQKKNHPLKVTIISSFQMYLSFIFSKWKWSWLTCSWITCTSACASAWVVTRWVCVSGPKSSLGLRFINGSKMAFPVFAIEGPEWGTLAYCRLSALFFAGCYLHRTEHFTILIFGSLYALFQQALWGS